MIHNRYDVYFIDMDTDEDSVVLGEQLRKGDRGTQFIYMSINPNQAQRAAKARCDYFITKPFDKVELIEIFSDKDNLFDTTPYNDKEITAAAIEITKKRIVIKRKDPSFRQI